ncbi:hypothetical protein HMPREF0574_1054 [Mobiluncus curtisii subsp. curtisii ATCC 35241]|uniref:Uncharacterized protein n=1 Tax=Mobiluncus curtisii (strain ATCC 43063 / DSM 2711 / V125) TaxID=548479 RepID=D6ZKB8_MOBCV|nr:hypothetical protein HMPREF0573_10848 [Mobiluncus curtisii ATCC 43063]EFL93324.1 hypothetical protein HMPREF0574_1054 [Mobiluncus curtisii subsp. curtisii ATCC 35241]MCV0021142.1 transcriptional regulator [Mobiluncus curtisii]NMW43611.1 transcriptional regulator [Mobiluncus curtisii]NMW47708.1 transcriptional regulator [Mobiluncus curtisii]
MPPLELTPRSRILSIPLAPHKNRLPSLDNTLQGFAGTDVEVVDYLDCHCRE